jgi:hypothetical protein
VPVLRLFLRDVQLAVDQRPGTARHPRLHTLAFEKTPATCANSSSAWFVVDEMALYRQVGSPQVMAGQMRYLLEVAAMPKVTLTVMPAVVHPANESGFVIAAD